MISLSEPDMDLGEKQTAALRGLIAELDRGIRIVREVNRDAYTAAIKGGGSAGAHLRHNLDFVNALLNGLAERRVDYTDRTRDPLVETHRGHAIEEMQFAISRLENLTPDILGRIVMVRSEIDTDVWHTSSVSREIEFVHSHTVHHYAVVARLLASAGYDIGTDVGVAPSTLRYRSMIGMAA